MQVLSFVFVLFSCGLLIGAIIALLRSPRRRGLYGLLLYFGAMFFLTLSAEVAASSGGFLLDYTFRSLINALQVFSLDAGYGEILSNLALNGICVVPVHFYAILLLVIAPFIGGAAVLTVLADVFPSVKYSLARRTCGEIFIFSFLNEATLTIAQSLLRERGGRHRGACFVFANTWVESGNEDECQLVDEAKRIGAICIREDVTNLLVGSKKRVQYFLVREDQMRNLTDAVALAEEESLKHWQDCKQVDLYVYTQNDEAPEIVERIYQKVGRSEDRPLNITIVPFVTNTVYRLLSEEPLYQVLGPADQEESLTVAILGTDVWAVEFFKAVYWCGQLPHKALNIICCCQDGAAFEEHIRSLIPELDACPERPYCRVRFLSTDLSGAALGRLAQNQLKDAAVWLVSLGSDQRNLEVANDLKACLDSAHLLSPKASVVYYPISNDQLMHNLNAAGVEDQPVCRMCAFASKVEQCDLENLWGGLHELAWMQDDAWSNRAKEKTSAGEYRRRSSLASALHIQYRLYAFGMLEGVKAEDTREQIRAGLRNCLAQESYQTEHRYAIAEMEHRRWNAYTRTLGYRLVTMDEWEKYYDSPAGQARWALDGKVMSKDTGRRLHTCLVEYAPQPLGGTGFLEPSDWDVDLPEKNPERFAQLDQMDLVSWRSYRLLCKLRGEPVESGDDVKVYDVTLNGTARIFLIYDAVKRVLERRKSGCTCVRYFTPLRLAGIGPGWRKEICAELAELGLVPDAAERLKVTALSEEQAGEMSVKDFAKYLN